MANFTSIKSYRKAMQKRIVELRKSGNKGALSAATHQVMVSKRMAPRGRSGQLRGNIRKRQLKSGNWIAESWVPGNFKYNKWVNQSKGFRTLKYPRGAWVNGKRILPPGSRAVYGSAPSNWHWTGRARYWDLGIKSTRENLLKVTRKNVVKSLRVVS
jgi:hypothetical protein